MKQFNNFNEAKPYSDLRKLPIGGYVCGIRDAEVILINNIEYLQIKYDVLEGEYKSYFNLQYNESVLADKKYKGYYRIQLPHDGADSEDWSLRKLKTFITNIEESNAGFKWIWEEKQLKNKIFGAIFGEKEYDFNGRQGVSVALRSTVSANDIREGNFKIPDLWKLTKNNKSTISAMTEEDNGILPF